MTTELPPPTAARAAASAPPAPVSAPTLPSSGPPTPAVVPHIAAPRPWATVPMPTSDVPSRSVPDSTRRPSRRSERYGEPVAPVIRAGVVLVALVGTLAAQSWLFWVMSERRSLLVDIRDGVSITEQVAIAADDRVLQAALILLMPWLVTALALMAWMFRSYKNVGAWRPIEYGVGWSIFGWLVPFMNLLRPGKIMVEIVEGSPIEGRTGGLVWWWWLAWLVPGIVSGGLDLMGDSVDSLLLADAIQIGLIAISNVAALLLMVIVARATNDQRRRIARSAEPVDELQPSLIS